MTLDNFVKSVKSTIKGIGKYAAVSAALGASYFAGNKAYADGPDPATECVLSNVVCVSPAGDWRTNVQDALNINKNVYLTDGDLNTNDDYNFANPGIQPLISDSSEQVYGENIFNTKISRDGNGVIYGFTGIGGKLKDITLANAYEPVLIYGINYDNITLENINFENSGNQPIYFEFSDKPGNSSPNMHFIGILVNGGQLAIHFDDLQNPAAVNPDTKYPEIVDSFFCNIRNQNGTCLVSDAPYDINNGVYKVVVRNSTLEESDGNWDDSALTYWGGGGQVASKKRVYGKLAGGEFNPPTEIIEWNTLGTTLVEAGIRTDVNKEANPNRTPAGRPIINLTNPNPSFDSIYPNGRNGRLEAAFDENGDNTLTPFDLHKFRIAYNNQNPNRKTLSFHDINADTIIDLANDFTVFKEGYSGPTHFSCSDGGNYRIEDIITENVQDINQDGIPDKNSQNQNITCAAVDIPATSTWGQIVLALLVANAGTLALRKRSYPTLETTV